MITRAAGLPVSAALVMGCMKEFRGELHRLSRLREYMNRRHQIDLRTRRRGVPNNRLMHDLPNYITQTAAGYLIGEPIAYACAQSEALAQVLAAYRAADVDSVDCELAVDAAAYGRAVELVYADEQSLPRVAQIDPLCAFVVYGEDASHRPLFGVLTGETRDESGHVIGVTADVFTPDERVHFAGKTQTALAETSRERHFFGGVPMIEYWNNAHETGDFEGVLPLIDAYDALQSDRVNDKQQFTDAVLVLYGVAGLADDDDGRPASQRLRDEKTLCMPDGDGRVEFLTKQLSESDTEVLKESLRADIHKLSFVPDMSDASFGGNQSGVAMRYKLFGLTRLTGIKERWFKEALRERMRRVSYFLSLRGAPTLNVDRVDIVMRRAALGLEEECA